jgi:predicted transcriptional regulator
MAKKLTQKEEDNLSKTELDLLQSFFPEGKEITLKDILKRSGYSYEPIYRTLQELTKKGLITVKRFGKTLVYELNFKKIEARMAFYHYALERAKEFSKKNHPISTAMSELPEDKIDILAIFGSYAKGTQHEKSDVDVICVTSDNEIKRAISALTHTYGKEFSPVVLPKSEFAKIKSENKEFWHDLITYGIIFKGYDLFYYYAYLT